MELAEFRISKMKIPESIDIDLVDLGERGRTTYSRIEELAQSIKDNGLIQPLVLVPMDSFVNEDGNVAYHYGLDAGGRRLAALKLLGTTRLWHATTSDPERPGFVIKGEDQGTPLKRLYTEIAENLDREDLDWRDQMSLLTKAYRLAKLEANQQGKEILMRDFGAMVGTTYTDLQAAVIIHDEVVKNPEKFKDVTGIRAAYSMLLKEQAVELEKIAATKSMGAVHLPKLEPTPESVEAQSEPKHTISIPLSANFFHMNGLEFMNKRESDSVDHIITDPDYGVSIERLEASLTNASQGVAQKSVAQTLKELEAFIAQSWKLIRPQGFLVFWYDLDHHEKLQVMASKMGFVVQRWPLIWLKTDYRSNAAPAHNFCKNIEYAMVCRKPNATLAKAQMSSVYQCPTGAVTKELGHPFAKPYELWQWIYNAVCIKGQVVFDPFVGRGSSAIAAAKWGLRPVGTEMVEEHYHGLLFNLQNFYRRELGPDVLFT